MTRKDYERIVSAIRGVAKAKGATVPKPIVETAQSISDALAADNPRFDRERFLKACGIE